MSLHPALLPFHRRNANGSVPYFMRKNYLFLFGRLTYAMGRIFSAFLVRWGKILEGL